MFISCVNVIMAASPSHVRDCVVMSMALSIHLSYLPYENVTTYQRSVALPSDDYVVLAAGSTMQLCCVIPGQLHFTYTRLLMVQSS
jgi:hypothetical protein